MSRLYFHTKTHTAELRGSERGWLRHITANSSRNWWGLDDLNPFERALDIAGMIVPNSNAEYVRTYIVDKDRYPTISQTDNYATLIKDYAQQALDDQKLYQETVNRYAIARADPIRNVRYNDTGQNRLIDVLRTCLRVTNVPLRIGEHIVFSANVEFNTALATGNYAVCLAAKIHGWCEIHPWFEETDRAFFADLIDDALMDGMYRAGIWYTEGDGKRIWHEQGWSDVVSLLRDTTTHPGPVVMSSSSCDEFPNPSVSTQMPPWPDGVPEAWKALSNDQQKARKAATSLWYSLPDDQRWETAMAGIRYQNPWANITHDNLAITTFGPDVTLFDLFSPDRVDRVKAAFICDRKIEEDEEKNRVTQLP